MKIADIDKATHLRNYRENCLGMAEMAFGFPISVKLGSREDLFCHVPAEPIRQAIFDLCHAEAKRFEKELAELGVTIE